MLGQDLRYGIRAMRKSLGFTTVAVLSLALGIGTTTALFSVVYGVLISPYPYARPGEIWAPEMQDLKDARQGRDSYHLSEYLQVRKLSAFSDVMATSWDNLLLSGDHPPESLQAVLLSGNAFSFLGVAPVVGRTILPSDVNAAGEPEPVAVISFKAWQRWFAGDPAAIGKMLRLNDRMYTVIGVMPPRFGWYGNDSLWVPLATNGDRERWVNAIMRLAPGVTAKAAEQQLHVQHLALASATPVEFPKNGFRTRLNNYLDITVASGTMQESLRLLFGGVAFLLLIACANVANLQLARATTRAREVAVRMSIGAGRGHVFRQFLTESVLLSVAGGLLGLLLSVGLTRAIMALMPSFYLPNEARITVNGYVLAFSAIVSVLTGILFGLAPARQSSRVDLTTVLNQTTRGEGAGAAGGRTRAALVIVEVALAVVLLVGGALTIRGFQARQSVPLGFTPDGVLMVSLPLPPQRYPAYEQRIEFARSVLERVQALPGVESAAIGNGGFPYGGLQSDLSIEGREQAERLRTSVSLISADYAKVLKIPLLLGRAVSEQEIARASRVAVINEAAARLWPAGRSPVGSTVRLGVLAGAMRSILAPAGASGAAVLVVGVIGDTRHPSIREQPAPAVFIPYTLLAPTGRTLAVRAQGKPMGMLNAIRQVVSATDRDQPVARPITLEELMGFETGQARFNLSLFSFFGLLGLALAGAGIYSVLSYTVARRTHEIGIRLALGAQRGTVLALMLGMGARLAAVGLVIGVGGSISLGRYLRSEVFEVPVTDPVSLGGVSLVLAACALLACYIPARRAARMDPTAALRHD
jgi:predicted permease